MKLVEYNFDPLFEAMRSRSTVAGHKLIREFEGLDHVLHHYAYKLKDHKSRPLEFYSKGQVYSQSIDLLPSGGYLVSWDIEAIKRDMKKSKPPVDYVWVSDLLETIDGVEVNENHLAVTINNMEPVILVEYPCMQGYYTIDGTHRIVSRYRRNPNQTVATVIIKHPYHMYYMVSDSCRAIYAVHHNINGILNYMMGNAESMEVLQQSYFLNQTVYLDWLK